jgi:hypothetical protein
MKKTATSINYTTQSFCSIKFIPRMDLWIFKIFSGIWSQYKLMSLLHMLKFLMHHISVDYELHDLKCVKSEFDHDKQQLVSSFFILILHCEWTHTHPPVCTIIESSLLQIRVWPALSLCSDQSFWKCVMWFNLIHSQLVAFHTYMISSDLLWFWSFQQYSCKDYKVILELHWSPLK